MNLFTRDINVFLLLFVTFLAGCLDFSMGWDSDDSGKIIPSQTEIVRIEIIPNPVIGGEDITFTCIIKDSLDLSFNYQWSFSFANDRWLDSTITENSLTIPSPLEPGIYDGYVAVFNDMYAQDAKPAFGDFEYEVIEKAE